MSVIRSYTTSGGAAMSILLSPRRAVGMPRVFHRGQRGLRYPDDTKPWWNTETMASTSSGLTGRRGPDDSMHRHIIVSGDDALATTIVEELKRGGASIV